MLVDIPPQTTSIEEMQRSLRLAHEAVNQVYDNRIKELKQHQELLDNREKRLHDWEKHLTELDNKVSSVLNSDEYKHYTLHAETGKLNGNLQ